MLTIPPFTQPSNGWDGFCSIRSRFYSWSMLPYRLFGAATRQVAVLRVIDEMKEVLP